jgi:hypothetical protein
MISYCQYHLGHDLLVLDEYCHLSASVHDGFFVYGSGALAAWHIDVLASQSTDKMTTGVWF